MTKRARKNFLCYCKIADTLLMTTVFTFIFTGHEREDEHFAQFVYIVADLKSIVTYSVDKWESP